MNAIAQIAETLTRYPTSSRAKRGGPAPYTARVGQRFGEWTVLEHVPGKTREDGTRSKSSWLCRCECGAVRVVIANSLTRGASKSCGHETGGAYPRELRE